MAVSAEEERRRSIGNNLTDTGRAALGEVEGRYLPDTVVTVASAEAGASNKGNYPNKWRLRRRRSSYNTVDYEQRIWRGRRGMGGRGFYDGRNQPDSGHGRYPAWRHGILRQLCPGRHGRGWHKGSSCDERLGPRADIFLGTDVTFQVTGAVSLTASGERVIRVTQCERTCG